MEPSRTDLVVGLVAAMGDAERAACLRRLAESYPGPERAPTLTPEEEWWLAMLVEGRLLPDGEGWPEEVPSAALAADFARATGRQGLSQHGTETALGRFLQKVCPLIGRTRRAAPGHRREKRLSLPPLDAARRCWEDSGRPAPWAER